MDFESISLTARTHCHMNTDRFDCFVGWMARVSRLLRVARGFAVDQVWGVAVRRRAHEAEAVIQSKNSAAGN